MHGLRCYGNITRTRYIRKYLARETSRRVNLKVHNVHNARKNLTRYVYDTDYMSVTYVTSITLYTVSQKSVPHLACDNVDTRELILILFDRNVEMM